MLNRRGILGIAAGGVVTAIGAGNQRAVDRFPLPRVTRGRGCAEQAADGINGFVERAATKLLRQKAEDAERYAMMRQRRRERLKSMSDAARDAYALADEQEAATLWKLFYDEQAKG